MLPQVKASLPYPSLLEKENAEKNAVQRAKSCIKIGKKSSERLSTRTK